MWIRKSDEDRRLKRFTPIPTQVVSNEEFIPMPQSADQRKVEHRINELADGSAKKLGQSRREFLATTGGMAAAFMAMNDIFGSYFRVNEAEASEHAAYQETWPKDEFIFDVQLHHVKDSITGPMAFRRIAAQLGLNSALEGETPAGDELHLANFMKEVFFDSDTVMGIITGAPIPDNENSILPAELMINTRETLNEISGSKRMLSHGLAAPNVPGGMDEILREAEELKPDGWKCYTGTPVNPWRFDDEKVAYPFFEKCLELGITNISVHKGLPLPGTTAEHCSPIDIKKAALDWPDITFIVYHSGYRHLSNELPAGEAGVGEDGYLEWTTDLVTEKLTLTEGMDNVYMELGSVFGHTAITHPLVCGHLMGQLIKAFGSDHIVWGTDCIWWGSPQWQIEAFRRFQIPEELQEKFDYAAITDEDRKKIFGLNAAGIYGVDVAAARTQFPDDSMTKYKQDYQQEGALPSNTQYGWIRDLSRRA